MKYECRCYVQDEEGIEGQIVKCRICAAAPKMAELLRWLVNADNDQRGGLDTKDETDEGMEKARALLRELGAR